MTDNDKPDKVISGDALAMDRDALMQAAFGLGANSANKQITALVAENEVMRAELEGQKAFSMEVRAQRDYYADRVEEARPIIEALVNGIVTLRPCEEFSMCECGCCGHRWADWQTSRHASDCAVEKADTWLSKPAAWARDDKEADNAHE